MQCVPSPQIHPQTSKMNATIPDVLPYTIHVVPRGVLPARVRPCGCSTVSGVVEGAGDHPYHFVDPNQSAAGLLQRGGGVRTPTDIPQLDPHDTLIILDLHNWGRKFVQKNSPTTQAAIRQGLIRSEPCRLGVPNSCICTQSMSATQTLHKQEHVTHGGLLVGHRNVDVTAQCPWTGT